MQKKFKFVKEFNKLLVNLIFKSITFRNNWRLNILFSIFDVTKGGILDYWKLLEDRKLSENSRKGFIDSYQTIGQQNDSLNLYQMQSAFYLFLIGISLACSIFPFEIINSKKTRILSYLKQNKKFWWKIVQKISNFRVIIL